jgi:disulfide bond formation protein DsbB
MDSNKRPPTDTRRLRKQNERRLLMATIFLLVVVGGGLIGLFIGPVEMLAALPCLLSGAGAILGLYLLLGGVERWVNR